MVITLPRVFVEGTFTSGSTVMNEPGIRSAELVADLAQADLNDTALRMSIAVEVSFDDGLTWVVLVRTNDWQGGTVNARTGIVEPPRIRITPDATLFGQRVRVVVDTNKRVRVGGTITVI